MALRVAAVCRCQHPPLGLVGCCKLLNVSPSWSIASESPACAPGVIRRRAASWRPARVSMPARVSAAFVSPVAAARRRLSNSCPASSVTLPPLVHSSQPSPPGLAHRASTPPNVQLPHAWASPLRRTLLRVRSEDASGGLIDRHREQPRRSSSRQPDADLRRPGIPRQLDGRRWVRTVDRSVTGSWLDLHVDHRSGLLNGQRVTISPGPVPEPPGSGGTAGAGEAGAP